MKQIVVDRQFAGSRVDRLVMKILVNCSKSFIYKMFRKKNITLNQKKIKGSELVALGDVICFYFAEDSYRKFTQQSVAVGGEPLDEKRIIYQDANVLIYNKPKAILSQPGQDKPNLVDQYQRYRQSAESDSMLAKNHHSTGLPGRFGLCNRLDYNTTGVSIFGNNPLALRIINQAIRQKQVDKCYHALVKGKISAPIQVKGTITKQADINKSRVSLNQPTDLANGHFIQMAIQPLTSGRIGGYDLSLVEVRIQTGKSHQIRAGMAQLKHPIIGDVKYGDAAANEFFRTQYSISSQLLHSYEYSFRELDAPLDYLVGKTFRAEYEPAFEQLISCC